MFLFRLIQILIWLPVKIFMPVKVIGKKNLIKKGGAVYVCNHQSNLDAFILATNISRVQYSLAKEELFSTKFKRWFFRHIGAIPVNREKPQLSSIKECLKVLNKGNILTIFPQGTRSQTNEINEEAIKNGALMFALKTKTPIVPMWIEKKPKFFSFNKLRIGEPIYFNNYFDKKLTDEEMNEAEKILIEKLKELKNAK